METKEFQRWTARRKVELLLQLIRKLVDVCSIQRRRASERPTWGVLPRFRKKGPLLQLPADVAADDTILMDVVSPVMHENEIRFDLVLNALYTAFSCMVL